MIKVKLLNGNAQEFCTESSEVNFIDVLKSIDPQLLNSVVAVKLNGELTDLRTTITTDCQIELVTTDSKEALHILRHTATHIMAEAVKHIFPEAKVTIGPATETGFFYDFECSPFSKEDLEKIEKEMKKIIKQNPRIERKVVSRNEAYELMKAKNEPFKLELIDAIPEGETITLYSQDDFVDLCMGPHLLNTKMIKGFKLLSTSTAYWRGDKNNASLSRIYGTAFFSKEDCDAYLAHLEHIKNIDHNKIGREMELFTTVDVIGQGLPLLMPKGAKIVQTLQRWIEDLEDNEWGYIRTKTPLMAKSDLYKISGHWDHYKDGMFVLGNEETDKEVFALRPMTCPFQYFVYKATQHSYRDLPLRYSETSTLFRNEDSGEMHGLIRVRQFTISEGHLILRPEQLKEEFKGCLDLALYMLDTLGLRHRCTFRFSQWDPNNTAKYEGTPEQWDEAQSIMGEMLDSYLGRENYAIGIDEAAFYGPKLDIQMKNVFGKEDTIVTIQVDMLLAKKFGMEYTDSDNTQKTPYIIHRTSLGCYERTLALLLEEYAGALPLWLAPTQAVVMPLTNAFDGYAEELVNLLENAGIRVKLDNRNEKIGYRIREAQLEKAPYMIIVGENEQNSGTVSVRARVEGEGGTFTKEEFLAKLLSEIATKKH